MEFPGMVLQQVGILAVLAVIGIIAVRVKLLDDTAKSVIEKLVFYITLPLLIITKLSSLEFSGEMLQALLWMAGLTYSVLLLQILLGSVSAKLLKLPAGIKEVHILHTFLGNIVFLGFPLLDALFPGGKAILYAAVYQLVMNTVLWTFGIKLLSSGSQKLNFRNLAKLANPNTIALLIGLGMMMLGLKLPGVLKQSLCGLGSTTLYLAMLYIGILLAKTSIWTAFKKFDVWILSLNKLLFFPVFLLMGLWFMVSQGLFNNDPMILSVLIIEASMPCMTILVILAKRYGADDEKAMENFVVSTILGLLSLPLIIYLTHYLN
ncbi:MAG: AEC family transporter [Bacteroidales bacterium]|nr:AEC family transporter [Bacteroidales bacterium]MCF8403106.1 AEC family transporter [Bacteroidales bacterium]